MSWLKIIKRPETLVNQAFNALKKAITTEEFKVVGTLLEEKTGNDLGVSHTVLKDILGCLTIRRQKCYPRKK